MEGLWPLFPKLKKKEKRKGSVKKLMCILHVLNQVYSITFLQKLFLKQSYDHYNLILFQWTFTRYFLENRGIWQRSVLQTQIK